MLLPRRGENVLRTGCVLLGTVVGKQTLETSFRRNVARRVAFGLPRARYRRREALTSREALAKDRVAWARRD